MVQRDRTPARDRQLLLTTARSRLGQPNGIAVALGVVMLKLIGSYAIARLLGFGLVGAIVIYALISLLF